jgi:hypothetical protein
MMRLKIKNETKANQCKKIKKGIFSFFERHFSADAPWVQNHIAKCPRCQKRLAAIGRVNLALSFIKSQSHKLDLLQRANTQAINVLKHSLREMPKAQKLKTANPEPKLTQKIFWCLQPSMNLAACLLILFLMKCGIFSSMNKFQSQGKKAYKQYYVNQVGEDMAEDFFPSDFT